MLISPFDGAFCLFGDLMIYFYWLYEIKSEIDNLIVTLDGVTM